MAMIDYDCFDFEYLEAGSTGMVSVEDVTWIHSKWMVVATKEVKTNVEIRYCGFGETLEEAEDDCKKTILDYLYPWKEFIMEKIDGNLVEYLGDGLYVVYDGFGFELRANDFNNPTDVVYLEDSVANEFIKFFKKIAGQEE